MQLTQFQANMLVTLVEKYEELVIFAKLDKFIDPDAKIAAKLEIKIGSFTVIIFGNVNYIFLHKYKEIINSDFFLETESESINAILRCMKIIDSE